MKIAALVAKYQSKLCISLAYYYLYDCVMKIAALVAKYQSKLCISLAYYYLCKKSIVKR